jgi:hypothetical protein
MSDRLTIEIVQEQSRNTANETHYRRNKKFYLVGVSFVEPLPHCPSNTHWPIGSHVISVTSARGKPLFACRTRQVWLGEKHIVPRRIRALKIFHVGEIIIRKAAIGLSDSTIAPLLDNHAII